MGIRFLGLLLLASGFVGCAPETVESTREQSTFEASNGASRLLLLQFAQGETVLLQSQNLDRAPRKRRGIPGGDNARYELLDTRGRVVGQGSMRVPHEIHARFAAIDGPVESVHIPNEKPIAWVQIEQPAAAVSMRILRGKPGSQLSTILGEVAL